MFFRSLRNFRGDLCYGYKDIPLKIFFEVVETGDLKLLCRKGVSVGEEVLENCWEDIVRQNSKENGNLNYDVYIEHLQIYTKLLAEYNLVKACLMRLSISYDKTAAEVLEGRGHKVDRTDLPSSVDLINRRTNNLATKLATKRREIAELISYEGRQSRKFKLPLIEH